MIRPNIKEHVLHIQCFDQKYIGFIDDFFRFRDGTSVPMANRLFK